MANRSMRCPDHPPSGQTGSPRGKAPLFQISGELQVSFPFLTAKQAHQGDREVRVNPNFCPGVCLCRHTYAGCDGKCLCDCGSGIEEQKEGCQLEIMQNRETSVLRCLIPRGWSWTYCCTVFPSEGLLACWEGSQQDLQGYLRNGGPGRPVPGLAWAPGPCRPIPVGAAGFLCPSRSCCAPKPPRAHPSSEGRVRIYHLSLPAK